MRLKGKLVESCVLTAEKQKAMGIPEGTLPIGWWVGFKITDDDAWQRVKNGTYRMFSVEGKAVREPVEKSIQEAEIVKSSKRFDFIHEITTPKRIAKTFDEIFDEIEKYNPYHGKDGRFTSASGGGVATIVSSEGKAIITQQRISEKNVNKKIAEVRAACGTEYKPVEKEKANMAKVKERGGCDDAEAKKCVELADKVYEKAAKAEPKITEDIVSAVAGNNGQMYGLAYRMKQPTSMAGKISADAKDDNVSLETAASKIKDSVRYTAVFEDGGFVKGYNSVKKSLEAQGYEEVRCKNFFDMYEKGTSCQKAVQCVYKNKEGLHFELQFHTYSTQGAKEVNHKYYEEQRAVGTKPKRWKQLNNAMTQISSYSAVPDGVLDIPSHG